MNRGNWMNKPGNPMMQKKCLFPVIRQWNFIGIACQKNHSHILPYQLLKHSFKISRMQLYRLIVYEQSYTMITKKNGIFSLTMMLSSAKRWPIIHLAE